MSVKVTLQQQLTVLETITSDVPDVATPGATIRHDQFNVGPTTLNASSSPPVQVVTSQQYTGTQTIDLTAALGSGGSTVNGTGMKVQAVLITCLAANTGAMTVAPGASNGIDLFGAGAGGITVAKGGTVENNYGGNGPSVASGTKTITITPANSADKYNLMVVMG